MKLRWDILIAVLVLTFGGCGWRATLDSGTVVGNQNGNTAAAVVSSAELRSAYEQAVADLKESLAKGGTDVQAALMRFQSVAVPAEWREAHFALVMGLNALAHPDGFDPATALRLLQPIVDRFPWASGAVEALRQRLGSGNTNR